MSQTQALGPMAIHLHQKLSNALQPKVLQITDDSDKHKGHSGSREGGESHFSILIISDKFDSLNRVARQRLVNEVLAEELAGPVHALSLKCQIPSEA